MEHNVILFNKVLDNTRKGAVVIRSAPTVLVKTNPHYYLSSYCVLSLQLCSLYTDTELSHIYRFIPEERVNGLHSPHSTFHEHHS